MMSKPGACHAWRWLALGAVALGGAPLAQANRSGALPGLTGGPASGGATCQACHGVAVGGGSVEIVGLPIAYEPDAVYDLVVRISDPAQAGAGFELSVEDPNGVHAGELIRSDTAHTRFAGGNTNYLTHNAAGVADAVANWAALGGAAEYQIQWRAPATDVGPVTFWAAGNAINNDFTPIGDVIYTANQTIPAGGAPCPGDVDGNNVVDVTDLGTLLGNFGTASGASREDGDLSGDGAVDVTDLGELLSNFGATCGP